MRLFAALFVLMFGAAGANAEIVIHGLCDAEHCAMPGIQCVKIPTGTKFTTEQNGAVMTIHVFPLNDRAPQIDNPITVTVQPGTKTVRACGGLISPYEARDIPVTP